MIEFLSQLLPFQGLSKPELEQIMTQVQSQSLLPKEVLFQQGDAYQKIIYIIHSGKIVLQATSSAQPITLGVGEFLGLAHFLDASPYTATATALTAVELLALPAASLPELECQCPPLFKGINRLIAKYIRDRGGDRSFGSQVLSLPARRIMKSPLATCGINTTLRDAYEIMQNRKIGSLGVVDSEQKLLGLLNFISLAQATLIQGAQPDALVLTVACDKPYTVKPDTPLWQIEEIQHDHGVKYIMVIEDDKPIGMISQTDILNSLIAQPGIIFAEIAAATSFLELATLYQQVSTVAHEARENNHRASAAVRTISEFHLALQRRSIDLTLQEMEQEGWGSPPAAYAFILFGSASRKEMMLNPDQDNAIILADDPILATAAAQQWFQTFCHRVNEHLDEIGYALCPGNIMASNVMFHKTVTQWQQQIRHIIHLPTPKAARWANIFLDFDTLYGDEELTTQLSKQVSHELPIQPRLLKMMVADDAQGQAAVGWFNRLTTQRDYGGKGKIDIKRNGLRIIADAARIYALQHGIESRNTLDRLNALVRQGVLNVDFIKSIRAAFEELLDLLLEHQLHQLQNNQVPDKLIAPDTLSPLHHESLRIAMKTIKQFQQQLQAEFDTLIF